VSSKVDKIARWEGNIEAGVEKKKRVGTQKINK
jgi:hypothetical protein